MANFQNPESVRSVEHFPNCPPNCPCSLLYILLWYLVMHLLIRPFDERVTVILRFPVIIDY